jgi:hypothetical protein
MFFKFWHNFINFQIVFIPFSVAINLYASIYSTTISISLASFLIRYQGQFPYDIYISMYVLPVFIGTGNSMVILGKFFSVYLFLISCVECLVICIDSFEFCKSSRRVINSRQCGIYFRIILVVLSKIQGDSYFHGKPQCVMFFLKFRRNW